MGIYGNLNNITRSNFEIDKIYPNKVAMDDAIAIIYDDSGNKTGQNDDGVFAGRYVLVSYDDGSGYNANYAIDYKEENSDSVKYDVREWLGYDSTIWQKQYIQSDSTITMSYKKIASLNAEPPEIYVQLNPPADDYDYSVDAVASISTKNQYIINLPTQWYPRFAIDGQYSYSVLQPSVRTYLDGGDILLKTVPDDDGLTKKYSKYYFDKNGTLTTSTVTETYSKTTLLSFSIITKSLNDIWDLIYGQGIRTVTETAINGSQKTEECYSHTTYIEDGQGGTTAIISYTPIGTNRDFSNLDYTKTATSRETTISSNRYNSFRDLYEQTVNLVGTSSSTLSYTITQSYNDTDINHEEPFTQITFDNTVEPTLWGWINSLSAISEEFSKRYIKITDWASDSETILNRPYLLQVEDIEQEWTNYVNVNEGEVVNDGSDDDDFNVL